MESMMVTADQNAYKIFEAKDIRPTWTKKFPVICKGTFLFNITCSTPFYIKVVRANYVDGPDKKPWIGRNVTQDRVSFLDKIYGSGPRSFCEATSHEFFGSTVGIEQNAKCTYWLSYDRDRMVIKYGKGYRMKRTTILEYDYSNLEKDRRDEIRSLLFDPKVDRNVELFEPLSWETPTPELCPETGSHDECDASVIGDAQTEVDFDPLPHVSDLPYIVRKSSEVDLFYLDKYMYSGSLPRECQTLFDNITAANVDLNNQGTDPENQYSFKLSDAIRHSIETEGCLLYEKLKSKAGEFVGSDPARTYLRITLGKDGGSSLGIPYVLEIWPKDRGSPVHNHGNAYAIIRVLHGGLTIKYYNKISESSSPTDTCDCKDEPTDPLGTFDVKKDDITWISPNWYQTHRLWNYTSDFCATLQCYQYGANDNMHWPHFDYIKSCDIIGEFTPDSDFTFREMYNRVMKEYADRLKSNYGIFYILLDLIHRRPLALIFSIFTLLVVLLIILSTLIGNT